MKRLLLLVPVIIIIGCGLFGGEDFFPLNVGNKWEYSGYGLVRTDTALTMTMEMNITGEDKIGDNDVFVSVGKMTFYIRIPIPDTTTTTDTTYIRETKDAILFYETKTAAPDTFLLLPLKKDKSWKRKEIFNGDTITVTYTVKEQEDVTVNAGTYKKCWRIDGKDSGFTSKLWFADGAGMVKLHYEFIQAGDTTKLHMGLKTKPTIK